MMRIHGVLVGLALTSSLAAPAEAQRVGSPLYSVWGSSESDLWVGGVSPNVWHYDGHSWSAVSMLAAAGAGAHEDQIAVGGLRGSGANDVWAIGQSADGQPLAARWDGTRWSALPAPPAGTRALIHMDAMTSGGFVTLEPGATDDDTSFVLQWSGSAWTRRPLPIAMLPAGIVASGANVWVPGFVYFDPRPDTRNKYGVLAQLTAGRWTTRGFARRVQTDTMLGAASWVGVGSAGGRVFLWGEREDRRSNLTSTVRLFSGGAWRSVRLSAAWASAPPGFLLLGDGTLLGIPESDSVMRWTGTQWAGFAPPLREPGTGVASPATGVFHPWSPPGAAYALYLNETRLIRIAAGSHQVIFDTRCSAATWAGRPMCQALLGGARGVTAPAAPVIPAAGAPGSAPAPKPPKRATPPRGLPSRP